MRKKLGLALGSGGSRGVAHLGVLRALEEEGIKPDFLSGCSMGAVVGACYAKGMPVYQMMQTVSNLKKSDLLDISVNPVTKLGLLKGKKMLKLLLDFLGDVTFDRLEIPFCCVASDVLSGRLHVFREGRVATAVQASSCIPTLFRPVSYGDELLVDGGVLCRVPVGEVKEMGADVVIGVDALANTSEPTEKVPNIIAMILRVYDMMDCKSFTLARRVDTACDLWLAPPMEGMSQYELKNFDRAYEEGYRAAKERMTDIKRLLETGE